jgi:hypothetical protein
MQWKKPKNTDKYYWTRHVQEKMRYYGLSEQKILGVIRNPKRIETGIAPNTVAATLKKAKKIQRQFLLKLQRSRHGPRKYGFYIKSKIKNQKIMI